MEEMLNNHTSKLIATQVIVKFLYLILTLKNFILNGINYLQIKQGISQKGKKFCVLHELGNKTQQGSGLSP